MSISFYDSLEQTTKLFSEENLSQHTTTTWDGILTRFDKVNRKQELINRVCRELEDQLTKVLQDTDEIYYLGFSDIKINIAESKDEYESGIDVDSKIIECDVWEKIKEKKFEKMEEKL